jgi:hypothetical protein
MRLAAGEISTRRMGGEILIAGLIEVVRYGLFHGGP